MNDGLVTKQTPTSISFKATSNNVTAKGSIHATEELRNCIQASKVFRDAFGSKPQGNPCLACHQTELISGATIIQSSTAKGPIAITRAGLMSAVVEAYNQHHCLILRPDDVWQAILTQFSFYVNAHAEELRDCFVDFEGKKTLVIVMEGHLFSADFGKFARRMVDEKIAANLKDAEITEWLLPKFSTTTSNDRIAAAVTIMSTLQSYFEYVCQLMCGIPQVTLEGTLDDWRILRQKIDRLPQYDLDGAKPGIMSKWHALLAPVLDEIVRSAEGHPRLEFWDHVCSHHGGGSGPRYISGWIAVFGCFSDKGEWQGEVPDAIPNRYYHRDTPKPKPKWPFIETGSLPAGVVSVPVLVDDNGIQYDTQMLAGQFCYEMVGDGQKTVRPRTDWCIAYDGKVKDSPRRYKDGEVRPTGQLPE